MQAGRQGARACTSTCMCMCCARTRKTRSALSFARGGLDVHRRIAAHSCRMYPHVPNITRVPFGTHQQCIMSCNSSPSHLPLCHGLLLLSPHHPQGDALHPPPNPFLPLLHNFMSCLPAPPQPPYCCLISSNPPTQGPELPLLSVPETAHIRPAHVQHYSIASTSHCSIPCTIPPAVSLHF